MTATMIRVDDGFFIPKLEGFDDIKKDCIKVNVDLLEEEYNNLSYKELKGISIMERYYKKLENQIESSVKLTKIQKEFRIKNNIVMNLEKYLKKR
jgi:hypothetical protein